MKARKRIKALSQDATASKIQKAKAADQGAITYAKNKLRKTEDFLHVSPEKKEEMLLKTTNNKIYKRYVYNILY